MISGTAEVQTSLAASLVDYVATVQLLPVSVGNQTYCAWSGALDGQPPKTSNISDAHWILRAEASSVGAHKSG